MKTKLNVIAACLGVLCASIVTSVRAGEVIAHPSVTLSADEVKELYLGDRQLAGSVKLVPLDNPAEQTAFVAKVLQTDVAKYSARWTKKAFREGLTAPGFKNNDAETIAFVKATPGAVAYVGAAASGVKVLHKY
ncbi:MAG: hypothetical protein ABL900_19350 [Burkholderiaceae bacterium]